MNREYAFLRAIADGDPVARLAYADWLDEASRTVEATKQRDLVGLIQKVQLSASFDKRHPDPNQNYGIHGVDLHLTLIGPRGALSLVIFTSWFLPHLRAEIPDLPEGPTPAGLFLHSRTPWKESQQPTNLDCPFTGGVCYGDSSYTASEELFNILVCEGSDGLWCALTERYRVEFESPSEGKP